MVIHCDHQVRATVMISCLDFLCITLDTKKEKLPNKTVLFPACGQEAVGEPGRENVPAYSGLCYPGGCS
jgi:hypothetical protein